MAEDTLKNIVFTMVIVSLFGMLILSSVVLVGNDYGMDMSSVVGGATSLDKFNSSIASIEQESKDLKTQFSKGTIWSTVAGVVVDGMFGIGDDMVSMLVAPFDIVSDLLMDMFGVPAYVTSVILGLFIISIIFAIWRLIKIGD